MKNKNKQKIVNINKADEKNLQSLEGIGPVLSKRIVNYRKKEGAFISIFDLLKVPGISSKWLATHKEFLVLLDSPKNKEKPTSPLKKLGRKLKDLALEVTEELRDLFDENMVDVLPSEKRKNKRLQPREITLAAQSLGVEVACLKAVIEVESSGSGFLPSGRPKILFEGHVFWNHLLAKGMKPKKWRRGNEDILYPNWTRKHYKGGEREHKRLEKAKKIHEEAALSACSWGLFQVMGFNFRMTEYKTIQTFVEAQYISEFEHLKAFMAYIKGRKLEGHLKRKDWAKFAAGYNGRDYRKNKYDDRLEAAYRRFSRFS